MSVATEPLVSSFGMLDAMTRANLKDVTAQAAEVRPSERANNARWIVGHVVFWRSRVLEMLGSDPVWAQGEHMELQGLQKGDPPADVGPSWDRMLTDLAASSERLAEALERGVPDEVRDSIASLSMHEAYHVGQLGLLRRSMGLPGAIGQ